MKQKQEMTSNLPEYNNEKIYNRGRMDEKQTIAIRLYCMDTDIDDIVAIDTPILDTRRGGDMMNTLITEVLLVQLSYLSESQKINRKKRQAEGISKAKAKGTRFGKPAVTLPVNFPEVYRRYKRKELSVSEAADLCNMARTTFYDNVKRYEKSFKAK